MTDVRILTEPLGGSPLSRALQRGDVPARWRAVAPGGAEGWASRVRERAGARDWSAIWNELEPAIAATGEAAARLDRVRRSGGVVVTTGQQPGLFGGPIYTWTKAAGALALADAIQAATGVPTAAVFWAATDDADFLEASYTVLARVGGAEVLRHASVPPAGTSAGSGQGGAVGAKSGSASGRPSGPVRGRWAA